MLVVDHGRAKDPPRAEGRSRNDEQGARAEARLAEHSMGFGGRRRGAGSGSQIAQKRRGTARPPPVKSCAADVHDVLMRAVGRQLAILSAAARTRTPTPSVSL